MSVFNPITVGPWQAKNRLAFLATINNLGTSHGVSEAQLEFYARRSRGGVGTLITEAMQVHPTTVQSRFYPFAFEKAVVEQFAPLVQVCRQNDTRLIGQLNHAGGRGYVASGAPCAWSVSQERDFVSGTTPHAMSDAEIWEIIEAFVLCAQNLADAGFNGVELLAAHGFLISQFLSPRYNRRSDRWGGTTENRVRILQEIITRIRAKVPPTFAVGVKLSGNDFTDGGVDNDLACTYVARLRDTSPPDYVAVSQGTFGWGFDRHLPDMNYPIAPYTGLASGIRVAASGAFPVMTLGRIESVTTANNLIDSGVCDLVGLCRPLLADADLPQKWAAGEDVRPCVFCNVCWHNLQQAQSAYCIFATEELVPSARRDPSPSRTRSVRVIGAGLAGLEFARTASEEGHRVTVIEGENTTGGTFRTYASAPGRSETAQIVDWMTEAAKRAGAEIVTGVWVDDAYLSALDADEVLVAAVGSVPDTSKLEADARVMALETALKEVESIRGTVLIVDEMEDEPVYSLAEELARRGCMVRLATRQEMIARSVAYPSRQGILRRFDEIGIEVSVNTECEVVDGTARLRHMYSRSVKDLTGVSHIVAAGPYLSRPLWRMAGKPVIAVGDALSPRSTRAVLMEARQMALALSGGHA